MNCLLCKKDVAIDFIVTEDTKDVSWGRCVCGTIFHEIGIDKKFFGRLYLRKWKDRTDYKERFEYTQRIYVPLIEEMTFGRKFLDVGHTLNYAIDYLKDRGWITCGIDLVPNDFIQGDFENYKIEEKFDYINMGHCLESFHNPVQAIKKAYDLLNYNGLLLITHPDPDTIFELGLGRFGHWDYRQSHMFIAKEKLEDIAKRTGFDVILSRRNISQRFVMYNDLHLLLQRTS